MTDEENSVVLQQLRAIRSDMREMSDRVRTGLADVTDRMDAVDKHMAAFFSELVRINTKLTVMATRLDKIEQHKEAAQD